MQRDWRSTRACLRGLIPIRDSVFTPKRPRSEPDSVARWRRLHLNKLWKRRNDWKAVVVDDCWLLHWWIDPASLTWTDRVRQRNYKWRPSRKQVSSSQQKKWKISKNKENSSGKWRIKGIRNILFKRIEPTELFAHKASQTCPRKKVGLI